MGEMLLPLVMGLMQILCEMELDILLINSSMILVTSDIIGCLKKPVG